VTVVYIDVLFLLNVTVDYLLLLASARITGDVICRPRLACGALLGGAYAAAIFLPGWQWLAHPLCKLALAALMVLVGFWKSPRLLRVLLVFFCASAALGGVVLALQLLGTGGLTLENGVLYTGFDLRLLLVTVIVCYGVLSCVFRRAARHGHRGGELSAARLVLGEKSLTLNVLLDTGNTLTEPLNNRPVMVAEARAVASLLPPDADPADPVRSVARLADDPMGRRFRLLPYRAVGVAHGLLLAVRTDKVVLGSRELKGLLVALSPTPVSDGGGYQALMGDVEGKNWEESA
jgi:stage II sporulation protein GA (sporulation sigma-E factor processing peptidase)